MTAPVAPPAESAPPEPTFDVLALNADVRRAVDAMGYTHPTPVQRAVFEPAAEGRSLVVQARTGTGKTAAFGLPIVDRIVRPATKAPQVLVLCPTRELALQVGREIEQLGQFRSIHVAAIYGGSSMTKQIEAIAAGAQVLTGTPGRVLDHLRQRTLDPSAIRLLVLDEADEMLSMGFARELNAILELLPKNRQGLFFSATLPPDIDRLARTHLRDPEVITLSSDQVGALEIDHYVYVTRDGDKIGQLVRILEVEDPESAIIFCNTRDETQRVAEALKNRGFDADWLNGDLPQNDRERVMSATREGRLRFLVATDVAARGIDISHLTHVINYDFPETAEQYVHRTGRTGRAGRTGTAIALVGPKDIGNLYILRLTFKIRPVEKQLPSAGELKTRSELDVVQLFVEAF
jgi:ATP-dependent RNA helicase DeaD